MEHEERRRHVLINEYNRLSFAVKKKEAKLKELHESLKTNNLQPTNYNSEDTCKQVSLERYDLSHIHHLPQNNENIVTENTWNCLDFFFWHLGATEPTENTFDTQSFGPSLI